MLIAVMLDVSFHLSDSSALAQELPALFIITESAAPRAPDDKSSIASVREARISFDRKTARQLDLTVISFPLFDQKMRRAEKVNFEERGPDDFTWRGKLRGEGNGDVVLTFKNGQLAGLIYSDHKVYEIVPKGGETRLVEIDQSLFPECGGALTGDTEIKVPHPEAVVGFDSGDRIDVLVLYTAAVKASLGGDEQAVVFAQQAIDATNTSYINSRIRQRVRLVGARETAMVETGSFSTELSNLRANSAAATARNELGADLVAMLTNSTAACGVGYLMASVAGNPNNGFSVTARTCAVGNLSFAHELGHNMGSQHNPENGSGATYPYGYGHYVNGNYRTVMSYVDQCASGCVRRPYFSNPNVIFNGFPTGIANARDNSRSMNNTADAIAGYRYSGSSITLTRYTGREWLPLRISRAVTWTSDNLSGPVKIELSRDEGETWAAVIESTENDGSQIVNIYGRPTRRARLRIKSVNNPGISDTSTADISLR